LAQNFYFPSLINSLLDISVSNKAATFAWTEWQTTGISLSHDTMTSRDLHSRPPQHEVDMRQYRSRFSTISYSFSGLFYDDVSTSNSIASMLEWPVKKFLGKNRVSIDVQSWNAHGKTEERDKNSRRADAPAKPRTSLLPNTSSNGYHIIGLLDSRLIKI